jgi:poly(hydroxyalkanoate) depolymerase family esterase
MKAATMKFDMSGAMRLIKGGKLAEATSAIQRRLGLHPAAPAPAAPAPESRPTEKAGARFMAMTFTGAAGTRPYKLFIPSGYRGKPVPLIVMLHGCTQSPDDFAAGTRMNEAAERATCLVAWPGQTSKANMQKCWNWFNPADQARDSGEASLIAGITRAVMADYAVDPDRVYVAGLSAGGAAAAIMGNAYPDLYAAIGVHSGLACGAARDMPSAFAAMQAGSAGTPDGHTVPSIVFHGDRDTTVNARNGDSVVAQALRGHEARTRIEEHVAGYKYTKTVYKDAAGDVLAEKFAVRGAGHAWFGGSAQGSYTDTKGPDATHEMMRFFLEHKRRP